MKIRVDRLSKLQATYISFIRVTSYVSSENKYVGPLHFEWTKLKVYYSKSYKLYEPKTVYLTSSEPYSQVVVIVFVIFSLFHAK